MEKITRTLTVTMVEYVEVLDCEGSMTPKATEALPFEAKSKAEVMQYLHKTYGVDKTFFVSKMDVVSGKFEMDLAKFVANATLVQSPKAAPDVTDASQPEAPSAEPSAPIGQAVPAVVVGPCETPAQPGPAAASGAYVPPAAPEEDCSPL